MSEHAKALVRAVRVRKSFPAKAERSRGAQMGGLLKALATGGRKGMASGERFVALDDVSFVLNAGESLGVIGRNGSGKSTLMKVIAGVLTPDRGGLDLQGRLQALINLGAGFDRQLSGRANIQTVASLYGITGSRLAEISEQVVSFSELGEFIDRPIETYSSGMAARLGFSLCVHLEPEVLIIDEALSVGDGAFQNKCLLKLEELRRDGLSLLLVSHSMAHILQFCQTCIWLDKGRVIAQGASKTVVKAYTDWLSSGANPALDGVDLADGGDSSESDKKSVRQSAARFDFSTLGQSVVEFKDARFSDVPFAPTPIRITDKEITGRLVSEIYGPRHPPVAGLESLRCAVFNPVREDGVPRTNEPLVIDYEFLWSGSPLTALNISLHIYNERGQSVTTITTLQSVALVGVRGGRIRRRVEIDDLCLNSGTYVVMMPIHEGRAYLARVAAAVIVVKSEVSPTFGQINFACRYVLADAP